MTAVSGQAFDDAVSQAEGHRLLRPEVAVGGGFGQHLLHAPAGEDVPVVLFIDEAYDLFNNRTDIAGFNGEIITMLLTAMEPGKRTLSATAVAGNGSSLMSVTLNENTAVWMAGYEKDMRKALSSNSGMYRRVESITLPTPAQSSLWNTFLQTLKSGLSDYTKRTVSFEKTIRIRTCWCRTGSAPGIAFPM